MNSPHPIDPQQAVSAVPNKRGKTAFKNKAKNKGAKRRRKSGFVSTLTNGIFLANLLGLLILLIGATTLNQFSTALIDAKTENLRSQTQLIANLIGDQATGFGAVGALDEEAARRIMRRMDVPPKVRVRLFNADGRLVSDSEVMDADIEIDTLDPITVEVLPPISTEESEGPLAYSGAYSGANAGTYSSSSSDAYSSPPAKRSAYGVRPKTKHIPFYLKLQYWVEAKVQTLPWAVNHRQKLQRQEHRDIKAALAGNVAAGESYEEDQRLVSVAMPIKPVQGIVGAVMFETRDIDAILAQQRQGLFPLILVALATSLLSSLALVLFIAVPVRRLARAADRVLRSHADANVIPDLSARRDEIGDLSLVLRDMTSGLYERIDDIANFAADVAHEIKNPLTSLRSASESLRLAKTKKDREKMLDIIESDVARMDRLVTDISKASRMDAALARETPQPLDVREFLQNMVLFYNQTQPKKGTKNYKDVKITLSDNAPSDLVLQKNDLPNIEATNIMVGALENSLGQVVRNIIDNALTFSPKSGGSITIATMINPDDDTMVDIFIDDEGPGIPADNLDTIFDRFYTQRPKGAAFGNHSGLGLAICRQIMDAHKGTIRAENRTDDSGKIIGARFVATLPILSSS